LMARVPVMKLAPPGAMGLQIWFMQDAGIATTRLCPVLDLSMRRT
jgi:hypothetical protein